MKEILDVFQRMADIKELQTASTFGSFRKWIPFDGMGAVISRWAKHEPEIHLAITRIRRRGSLEITKDIRRQTVPSLTNRKG